MSEVTDLSIRQFKLMNGDEIIGLIESDNDTNFLVDRPFKIVVNSIKTDSFHLVPWFDLSLSNTFTIDKSMVVAHAAVADSIKETYITFAITLDSKINALGSDTTDDDNIPDLIPDIDDTIH